MNSFIGIVVVLICLVWFFKKTTIICNEKQYKQNCDYDHEYKTKYVRAAIFNSLIKGALKCEREYNIPANAILKKYYMVAYKHVNFFKKENSHIEKAQWILNLELLYGAIQVIEIMKEIENENNKIEKME